MARKNVSFNYENPANDLSSLAKDGFTSTWISYGSMVL
jgi:hypothetical protein